MTDGCFAIFFALMFMVFLPLLLVMLAFSFSPWGCEYRWPDQETYWQPFMCYVVIDDVRYPEKIISVVDGVVKVAP